ncbi:hypothetical protein [Stygiolobus caldivivus]|uniref:Uncharacterized protein n=1 Tax=Stygiolobus caldivivus TaxID=2824673 RepID=A0A8D5U4Y9_9CREN|nr:hypothetical protein [Stygiolobus caldivivus]BCU69357.1 hypothetical protein KN1_06540 [Stygiolobus caldivivus]
MSFSKLINYYSYVIALTILFIIVALALGPLAPIDEPTHFPNYDLEIPVGLSFSGFILLIVFIIVTVLFWGSESMLVNSIIDSSALSFAILNYLNFYLIYTIWKPEIYVLPLFFYVKYGSAPPELILDFGQIALIVFFYRLYRRIKSR